MKHTSLAAIPIHINLRGIPTRTLFERVTGSVKQLLLNAGQGIPVHTAPLDVVFFILSGSGSLTIGDNTNRVVAHDVILCPQGTSMAVQADDHSPLTFLNIKIPSESMAP